MGDIHRACLYQGASLRAHRIDPMFIVSRLLSQTLLHSHPVRIALAP
jgi:hypothetical protein